MQNFSQTLLFIATVLWAVLTGAIVYSHISFLPSYLADLPESSVMVNGKYAIRDENFWMNIHPFALLATISAFILNRKNSEKRNLILIPLLIYITVLIITAIYFVPELLTFAKSDTITGVSKDEWLQRGSQWQILSLIRGCFMFAGFICLQKALIKGGKNAAILTQTVSAKGIYS